MRYFLHLSYKGTDFHGWQRQPNAISVQQVLEDCLCRFTGVPVSVTASGRTDSGVHALDQVVHLDLENLPELDNFCHRLNKMLPPAISLHKIYSVPDDAHARFGAVKRMYEYRITHFKDPFLDDTAYLLNRKPDVALMNKAANLLLEAEDFQAFSKANTDVKTFLCKLYKAQWRYKEELLVFEITANRFLRNMVRAIVGTLLWVGLGKWQPDDVKSILISKNRSAAGPSVPAHGLYLTGIEYPSALENN